MLLLLALACGGDPPPSAPTPPETTEAPPPAPTPVAAVTPPVDPAAPVDLAAPVDPSAAAPAAPMVPGAPVPPGTAAAPAATAPGAPKPPTAPTPGAPAAPTPVAAAGPPAAATPPAGPPAAGTSDPVAAAPAAPVIPTSWKLDTGSSKIYVQVFKDPSTPAAGLSHDHVMAAGGWTGSVVWNAADPASCKVSIDLPVSGLKVDEPAMRKKVGYDTELSDSQRSEVKGNMLSDSQLAGSKYPTITYRSTGCTVAGDKVNVAGTLTIHGTGKTLTVPMKITATESRFTASGTFKAKASDFGFQPFSAMFGALKNLDTMSFAVDVVGTP